MFLHGEAPVTPPFIRVQKERSAHRTSADPGTNLKYYPWLESFSFQPSSGGQQQSKDSVYKLDVGGRITANVQVAAAYSLQRRYSHPTPGSFHPLAGTAAASDARPRAVTPLLSNRTQMTCITGLGACWITPWRR